MTITTWRKSSYSGGNGACAECRSRAGTIEVRDSKNRGGGPVLVFPSGTWREFTAEVKTARRTWNVSGTR